MICKKQSFEKFKYSSHCNLVFKLDAGFVCTIQNNKTFFELLNQFRLIGQSMANHSIISGVFRSLLLSTKFRGGREGALDPTPVGRENFGASWPQAQP